MQSPLQWYNYVIVKGKCLLWIIEYELCFGDNNIESVMKPAPSLPVGTEEHCRLMTAIFVIWCVILWSKMKHHCVKVNVMFGQSWCKSFLTKSEFPTSMAKYAIVLLKKQKSWNASKYCKNGLYLVKSLLILFQSAHISTMGKPCQNYNENSTSYPASKSCF